MSAKKKLNEVTDPDFLAEIGCVPMTDEAISKMSINPYDQLFLCRLMSLRDEATKEDLKTFLQDLYEKDNDMVCKNIAEIVTSQNRKMFDAFAEQNRLIGVISSNIGIIKRDVINIKDRLEIMEDKIEIDEKRIKDIEDRLDNKKIRIEKLESQVDGLKPELIEELIKKVDDTKPVIEKLIKTQTWKSIGFRIALAVAISALLTIGIIQIHNWRLHVNKTQITNPFKK